MSRFLLIVTVLTAVTLLASCNKTGNISPLPAKVAYLASDSTSGFCIVGTSLYGRSGQSYTRKANVQIGEKLAILEGPEDGKLPGTAKNVKLIRVRQASETEGWVKAECVVPNSILGVVIADEVTVYSQPFRNAATDQTIPRLSLVAMNRETAAQSFVRVATWDKAKGLLTDILVKNEGISTRAEDVQAADSLFLRTSRRRPLYGRPSCNPL